MDLEILLEIGRGLVQAALAGALRLPPRWRVLSVPPEMSWLRRRQFVCPLTMRAFAINWQTRIELNGRHIRLLISSLQYICYNIYATRALRPREVRQRARDEQILDSYRCLHIIIWRVYGISGENAFCLFDLLAPVMIILRATHSQCRFWTST